MTENKSRNHEKGKFYETVAADHLQKQGMQLLDTNFRCRLGEIDIIGLHEGNLVFVEVKYRKTERAGMPEEAVGVQKQIKICKTSDYFRYRHPELAERQVRYDVVAVCGERLTWYQDAFAYIRGNSLSFR